MHEDNACTGCNKTWIRGSDLSQHHLKTSEPACLEAAHLRQYRKATRRFRNGPRSVPPSFLQRRHSSPASESPSTSTIGNATPPEAFAGDFFGNVYTADDFPGFESHNKQGPGEDKDDERRRDEDEDEDGVVMLEQFWEPVRTGTRVTSHDMEAESNDSTTPPSPQTNTLQHLPSHREDIFITRFGGQAGAPVSLGRSQDGFQHYQSKIHGSQANMWAPFETRMEWEICQWAKMRGTGSTAFSDLLAIQGVRSSLHAFYLSTNIILSFKVTEALGLSFTNSLELNKIIDTKLPSRRPIFSRKEVVVAEQAFDLYVRDILECIQALYGNPEHCQYMCFTPERHYADPDKTIRLFHDFNTGRWWWDTQVCGGFLISVVMLNNVSTVASSRRRQTRGNNYSRHNLQ